MKISTNFALLILYFLCLKIKSSEIFLKKDDIYVDAPSMSSFATKLRSVSRDQWCGDGICDVLDETSAWCPDDCSCGDGHCDVSSSPVILV